MVVRTFFHYHCSYNWTFDPAKKSPPTILVVSLDLSLGGFVFRRMNAVLDVHDLPESFQGISNVELKTI
jgi:hypothetical protein